MLKRSRCIHCVHSAILCFKWPLLSSTSLTDFIDANGGSAELISALNRLGAVASTDTLNYHICAVSLERKKNRLLKDLNCEAYTIATTDNIDSLQSHASVYAGSQY
jgi:hypothetical protein